MESKEHRRNSTVTVDGEKYASSHEYDLLQLKLQGNSVKSSRQRRNQAELIRENKIRTSRNNSCDASSASAVSNLGDPNHPAPSVPAVERRGGKAPSIEELDQERKELESVEFKLLNEGIPRGTCRKSKNEKDTFYEGRATMFHWAPDHPFRQRVIDIVDSKWFDRLVLVAILINSILLMLEEPNASDELLNKLDIADKVFTFIFTVEMLLKTIASGFICNGPYSYLRDGWNIVDFVVVILGYAVFIPGESANYSAIRSVRVLRPLRTISSVPGLRVMVNSLFKSLRMLLDVVLLLTFIFFIFGIVGMQLFGGKFRQKCHFKSSGCKNAPAEWLGPPYSGPLEPDPDSNYQLSCNDIVDLDWCVDPVWSSWWGETAADVCCGCDGGHNFKPGDVNEFRDSLCAMEKAIGGTRCPSGSHPQECLDSGNNPNYGVTGFDNILQAWLTVLQCISLEGWVDVMYMSFDTTSYWSSLYFIFLILVGAFFVINLVIAVVYTAYQSGVQEEEQSKKNRTDENIMTTVELATRKVKSKQKRKKRLSRMVDQKLSISRIPTDASGYSHRMSSADSRALFCDTGTSDRIRRDTLELPPELDMTSLSRRSSMLMGTPTNCTNTPIFFEDEEEFFKNYEYEDDEEYSETATDFSDSQMGRTKPSEIELTDLQQVMEPNLQSRRHRPSKWKQLRTTCNKIADSKLFTSSIVILIVLNTVFLASEFHDQGQLWTDVLEISNYFFTAIFALEMIIKLLGYGWKGYISDSFNIFDAAIVTFSVIEIMVTLAKIEFAGGLSALRTVRLLRVFKLARNWTQLQLLLETILRSFKSLLYFTAILLLFIFVYSLLGMQLLGGRLKDENGEAPRANFDNFWWCIVTVFQIIGGENWNEVMYSAIYSEGWWSVLYFVSLFVIGNYILLSLFLAILLSNFGDDSTPPAGGKVDRSEPSSILYPPHDLEAKSDADTIPMMEGKGPEEQSDIIERRPSPVVIIPVLKEDSMSMSAASPSGATESITSSTPPTSPSRVPLTESMDNRLDRAGTTTSDYAAQSKEIQEQRRKIKDQADNLTTFKGADLDMLPAIDEPHKIEGVSLGFLKKDNRFRLFVASIINHPKFEHVIMFFILASTILLALQSPHAGQKPAMATFLLAADFITTIIFTTEMVLKIIALGLFGKRRSSYLGNPWNVLDACIVVVSICDLVFGDLSFFKAFRAFRALRMVGRLETMRVAVFSIFKTIPQIGQICLVAMLFYLIFGILGIQLFAGKFFWCETPIGVLDLGEKACAEQGGTWRNPSFGNFDNIGNAILLLFEVASMEMWPDVMYRAVDTSGFGMPPIRDNHQIYALYFIIFIVVGNFFVVNLFVGVVCDTFYNIKEEITGFSTLTKRQRLWVEIKRILLHAKGSRKLIPPRTDAKCGAFRMLMFNIVDHSKFEVIIITCILLNIVIMSIWFYDASDRYLFFLRVANIFFTSLFTVEAIVKNAALGPVQYFSSSWNTFDFVIVVVSIIAMIVEYSLSEVPFDPTVIRVLRIFRIFRLVKQYQGLRRLVQTLIFALPAMANIGSLLMLLFFIYAVMGVALFGGIEHGEFITEYANFDNFLFAMLTLFRMATGESWNGLMHDTMAGMSCAGMGCSTAYPAIYFVSFVVLGQFMMLNLFIAIVLEHFDSFGNSSSDSAMPITYDDLTHFSESWAELGEKKKHWFKWWDNTDKWMRADLLEKFLSETEGCLGLAGKDLTRSQRLSFVDSLNIPMHERLELVQSDERPSEYIEEEERYVHYYETMLALTYAIFRDDNDGTDFTIPEQCHAHNFVNRQLKKQYKELSSAKVVSEGDAAEIVAATRLQAAFRGRITRQYLRETDFIDQLRNARNRQTSRNDRKKQLERSLELRNERHADNPLKVHLDAWSAFRSTKNLAAIGRNTQYSSSMSSFRGHSRTQSTTMSDTVSSPIQRTNSVPVKTTKSGDGDDSVHGDSNDGDTPLDTVGE